MCTASSADDHCTTSVLYFFFGIRTIYIGNAREEIGSDWMIVLHLILKCLRNTLNLNIEHQFAEFESS